MSRTTHGSGLSRDGAAAGAPNPVLTGDADRARETVFERYDSNRAKQLQHLAQTMSTIDDGIRSHSGADAVLRRNREEQTIVQRQRIMRRLAEKKAAHVSPIRVRQPRMVCGVTSRYSSVSILSRTRSELLRRF